MFVVLFLWITVNASPTGVLFESYYADCTDLANYADPLVATYITSISTCTYEGGPYVLCSCNAGVGVCQYYSNSVCTAVLSGYPNSPTCYNGVRICCATHAEYLTSTLSTPVCPLTLTTYGPTRFPTLQPTPPTTHLPSSSPTTTKPTASPSSSKPTKGPTKFPTTTKPSKSPSTAKPSSSPTTTKPTTSPSLSKPTKSPSSSKPSRSPSISPGTYSPTDGPSSSKPSRNPTTTKPTRSPSHTPSLSPTWSPVELLLFASPHPVGVLEILDFTCRGETYNCTNATVLLSNSKCPIANRGIAVYGTHEELMYTSWNDMMNNVYSSDYNLNQGVDQSGDFWWGKYTNCLNWTSTTACGGADVIPTLHSLYCSQSAYLLCLCVNGVVHTRPSHSPAVTQHPTTLPPTHRPSTLHPTTPTTQQPSISPTASRPSSSPTISKPSKSPSTSRPTTLTPTTHPTTLQPTTLTPTIHPTTLTPSYQPTIVTFPPNTLHVVDFDTIKGPVSYSGGGVSLWFPTAMFFPAVWIGVSNNIDCEGITPLFTPPFNGFIYGYNCTSRGTVFITPYIYVDSTEVCLWNNNGIWNDQELGQQIIIGVNCLETGSPTVPTPPISNPPTQMPSTPTTYQPTPSNGINMDLVSQDSILVNGTAVTLDFPSGQVFPGMQIGYGGNMNGTHNVCQLGYETETTYFTDVIDSVSEGDSFKFTCSMGQSLFIALLSPSDSGIVCIKYVDGNWYDLGDGMSFYILVNCN